MLRFDCPSCLAACHLPPDKLPPGNRARVACPSCGEFLILRRRFAGDILCELENPQPMPPPSFFAPPAASDGRREVFDAEPPPVPQELLSPRERNPRLPAAEPGQPMQKNTAELLQDFSVLFRLDERSKRQEHMIAVMGLLLFLGAGAAAIWVVPDALQGHSRAAAPVVLTRVVHEGPSAFSRAMQVTELGAETVASAHFAVLPAPRAPTPAAVQAVTPVVAVPAEPARTAKAPAHLPRLLQRAHLADRPHFTLPFLPPDDIAHAPRGAAGPSAPSAPAVPRDDSMIPP